MTKYYCDICGCEVSKVEEFILPILGTKDMCDTHGTVLKRFSAYNPKSVEICNHCKNDCRAKNFQSIFRHISTTIPS